MAYYYGVNKGKNIDTVVVGTSTNNTDVEIVVNATNVTDREALLIAMEALEGFIINYKYPPA